MPIISSHQPDYAEYVNRLAQQESALAEQVADFHGIEHVLQWMQTNGLCHTKVDIVGQDEFHYDFLVEMPAAGQWIVFGVT